MIMPIIIRETVIRADVSGSENQNVASDATSNEDGMSSGAVLPAIEAQVQKTLLQIEKKREER
jgi:hypothetical protein